MIALLENGNYLSTVRLVDPNREQITRTAIAVPEENTLITERVGFGLGMDFTTMEATLMQVSCMAQEEKISGQGGFAKFHGILDLMALEEAGILQNITVPQGDAIIDPWQLQGFGFSFHHELFKRAVDMVAVTPVDWEEVETNRNRRSFLYTKNFTSSFAFSRMLDPDDSTRYGSGGYQISTLVDRGDVVFPVAPAGVMGEL